MIQIRCSNQLKEEGNRLFSAQKTEEAIEKYRRAKGMLKGRANAQSPVLSKMASSMHAHHAHAHPADSTSGSGRDVRMKCALNLASCYLRLGEHADVIRECSEVLEAQPEDRKALYRRGQAHLAMREHARAVDDLQKALVR